MNKKYFSGIGSRKTPNWLKPLIHNVCTILKLNYYILRSGGADGADEYFYENYKNNECEIWVPWLGFNNSISTLLPSPEAFEIAATIHPVWNKLRPSVKALHARNCHQILGKDLNTPSKFVLCWTPGGETIGGTATAINLALNNHIPVLNFGKWDNIASMKEALQDFLILMGEEIEI